MTVAAVVDDADDARSDGATVMTDAMTGAVGAAELSSDSCCCFSNDHMT